MYYTAKVLGQIFANPPFFVLRCYVSGENSSQPEVVKGKIVGPVTRGAVFTFKGRHTKDKNGRPSLEVVKNPVRPALLRGEAKENFENWAEPDHAERVELLSLIAESGANVSTLNSLWGLVRRDPAMVRDNPWILVDKGLSFKSADRIAQGLLGTAFNPTCDERVSSACLWSVTQGALQGNTFLDVGSVFKDVALLTGLDDSRAIALCVKNMVSQGRIVVEKRDGINAIYHPSYHRMEVEVADLLRSPLRAQAETDITDDEIRAYTRYALTEDQIKGIRQGLTHRVSVVTGLPGTGKTTILSTLSKILRERKESVLLVAPTGIAAKRAQSVTGIEASTIHRAFGAGAPAESKDEDSDYEGVKKNEDGLDATDTQGDPTGQIWEYHPDNPRTESVVIVDESSMVDLHLMWRILRGISFGTRVIMVGDAEQLPPVGVGFTLKDIIKSNAIPRIHLDKVFRQGEGSDVVMAAHAIHRGEEPSYQGDFELLRERGSFTIVSRIVDICRELNEEGVDYHVISPTHHGDAGVTSLNRELRSALNPNVGLRSVRVGDDEIRMGDKVMVTKNDYELMVFNGDIGTVDQITSTSVMLLLKDATNTLVEIPIKRVGGLLRLAYATTVHKAQGQEYDTVVMPLSLSHGQMLLKRPLVYTAVTRAKKKVILVGDPTAMSVAIRNRDEYGRYSRLAQRLSDESF